MWKTRFNQKVVGLKEDRTIGVYLENCLMTRNQIEELNESLSKPGPNRGSDYRNLCSTLIETKT